jgi:predicted ATP-binding protein involved in virulence
MYLEKLLIVNYKSCNLVELDFEANEPNILIGINDCGKSTILKAVENLLAIKSVFNFVKDDKKKNDLSNTRASPEVVNALFKKLGLPLFPYDDKKCLLIGKFFIEEEELQEDKTTSVTPQLLWVLDNIDNNIIWAGKIFDDNSQTGKDCLLTPDYEENGSLVRLYNSGDADLRTKIKKLEIKTEEIENDNRKGRYKKMELARAIYNRNQLSWYWSDYESRPKDTIFPECRYLDWNISLDQLTQFATDVINTKITSQIDIAERFANRQAKKAQQIINQELQNFTTQFATDIPNIIGFKANLSLQVKSQLTDILINKSNTDGDIHLEQQGEGVKRQIWFALIKWKALGSLQEEVNAKKFIWCFDEPETHLYPKAQREFFDLIKSISSGNVQSLISTHSTVFIDRANFNSICKVELLGGYTLYSKCTSVPDIYHALQVKNSDFLFYDKFLIVEGDTEEHLIPQLFKVVKNEKTMLNYGIQIINLGGKSKRSQNKLILESVLKDFNKATDSIVYLFDNDVIFDGLTAKELSEIVHFRVGKQDIEDSISVEIWFNIVQSELPEISITIEEITEIHSSIPDDRELNSNQKFYPKLRSALKQKLGEDNRHIVNDKLPEKGRLSAELLARYLTDIQHIDSQIIAAFEKLTEN